MRSKLIAVLARRVFFEFVALTYGAIETNVWARKVVFDPWPVVGPTKYPIALRGWRARINPTFDPVDRIAHLAELSAKRILWQGLPVGYDGWIMALQGPRRRIHGERPRWTVSDQMLIACAMATSYGNEYLA